MNSKDGGYERVFEFVPICTPSAATIAKINSICPSEEIGDRRLPFDAIANHIDSFV